MKRLSIFGVLAVISYLVTIIVGSILRPEYTIFIDPVSRIFAKGLPHSGVIVSLFVISNILIIIFAIGMLRSVNILAIRTGMISLILACITGSILFVFFPMDPWQGVRTSADIMHNNIVTGMALLMLFSMIFVYFGSKSEEKLKRLSNYLLVSTILFLVCGIASSICLQYYWNLIGTFESSWIIIFLQWLTVVSLNNREKE